MNKGRLSLFLCLVLLVVSLPLSSALSKNEEPLYTAMMRYNAAIYNKVDGERIASIGEGKRVEVYEVLPAWLKVGSQGKILGYMRREFLDDYTVKTLNPATTPNYPGIQHRYLMWVKGETSVLASPNIGAERLIDLSDGCRLALISIEDGFGKLIFHRQYGYVDMRQASKLLPVNISLDPKMDAPIAAYTSFYDTSTVEENLNRIINLRVSCERLAKLSIPSGGACDFNQDVGPFTKQNGYERAIVLVGGGKQLGHGGGTCQTASTLYNTLLQLPGLIITYRRPHGPRGAEYLPHGADAAVGNSSLNLKFVNHYPFPVRIEGSVQDGALTIVVWRADGETPLILGE